MEKPTTKHSEHYYEKGRNTNCTFSCTSDNCKCRDNLEAQLEKGERLTFVKPKSKDNRVPEYYKGKNGYEARKVCDNFELPYHLATATTYILRAYHKHDTPIDCLTKAIAHLEFELEKIKDA